MYCALVEADEEADFLHTCTPAHEPAELERLAGHWTSLTCEVVRHLLIHEYILQPI